MAHFVFTDMTVDAVAGKAQERGITSRHDIMQVYIEITMKELKPLEGRRA